MADAAPAPKRPKRFMKIVGLVFLFLLVVGLSAGGFWWWQQRTAAQAATPSETPEAHAETPSVDNSGALITFEPFLVNLSGNSGSQFLRTKVQLVVADEGHAKELEEQPVALMRLRSSILELLAEQTADTLVTADGKAALKKSIQERASQIAGVSIVDVLFSDFVVQF